MSAQLRITVYWNIITGVCHSQPTTNTSSDHETHHSRVGFPEINETEIENCYDITHRDLGHLIRQEWAQLVHWLVDNFLRLLGPLSQGLDQLVHGRAGYEGSHDPPPLLQPHPDHLDRRGQRSEYYGLREMTDLHLGVLTLLLSVIGEDGLHSGPHT